MKTMLRATCAILVTVSMVTSAFAETSISDTSSLASISVNIGSKTYSGDEARKYLFSRVQTQENTRITTDAKVQFLQGFNIKLSKVAGSYETRGGKASEIAKLLRAIGEDIQSEIMKLSGVSVNSAIIQTTSTTTESELAYYKGNAYKKDGFINTLNVNIEGSQTKIQDLKKAVQSVISNGTIPFSETYGLESFSSLAKGTDTTNIAYHRYFASDNGVAQLKGISITMNANSSVVLIENYTNGNKLVLSTFNSNPDIFGKISAVGGTINRTPFGSSYNPTDASISGLKATDRGNHLLYMYVPENTSANITPDTTKVSSVTGIEIVYYKGYPYMRHGIIDTNGVSIKITPYVGTSESKIQETTKMINDFYSNSFDFGMIPGSSGNSSKIDKDELAYHRYYVSHNGKLKLTSLEISINKDSSIGIKEFYGIRDDNNQKDGTNQISIILGKDNIIWGGAVNGALFKLAAQLMLNKTNRSEPGYNVLQQNIDFYHPN